MDYCFKSAAKIVYGVFNRNTHDGGAKHGRPSRSTGTFQKLQIVPGVLQFHELPATGMHSNHIPENACIPETIFIYDKRHYTVNDIAYKHTFIHVFI